MNGISTLSRQDLEDSLPEELRFRLSLLRLTGQQTESMENLISAVEHVG